MHEAPTAVQFRSCTTTPRYLLCGLLLCGVILSIVVPAEAGPPSRYQHGYRYRRTYGSTLDRREARLRDDRTSTPDEALRAGAYRPRYYGRSYYQPRYYGYSSTRPWYTYAPGHWTYQPAYGPTLGGVPYGPSQYGPVPYGYAPTPGPYYAPWMW